MMPVEESSIAEFSFRVFVGKHERGTWTSSHKTHRRSSTTWVLTWRQMYSAEVGSSAATCPNYIGPLRKSCVVLCIGARTAMGGHIWQC